jgi:hypothetical protein
MVTFEDSVDITRLKEKVIEIEKNIDINLLHMLGKEMHHSAKAIYEDRIQKLENSKKELCLQIIDLIRKEKLA